MNYYPYFNSIPYVASAPVKTSFFKNLFGGINFSSILNGTQKTLGIVNQAIPLIKQAKPVLNNAKTMFKVMNEFKRYDISENTNTTEEVLTDVKTTNTKKNTNNYGPTFFH